MTIGARFCRYCELLGNDIEDLSPYTMGSIIGFGKFGGYDPIYLDIRNDVLRAARLYLVIDPTVDLSAVFAAPAAQTRRPLDVELLAAEKAALGESVLAMLLSARALGPTRFAEGWDQCPEAQRDEFLSHLIKAGVAEEATPPPAQAAMRGDPIYVSPLAAGPLSRQILPALREAGHWPVAADETLTLDLNPSDAPDWNVTRRRIAACRGGVMCFTEHAAAEADREIDEGLKAFPNRMLIIAEARLIKERLGGRDSALMFPIAGTVMNEQEMSRFAEIVGADW